MRPILPSPLLSCLLAASAAAWHLPRETSSTSWDQGIDPVGWTPKPTPAPGVAAAEEADAEGARVLDLLLRRTATGTTTGTNWTNSETCGWVSGTSSYPWTCDSGATCATNAGDDVVACASGTYSPFYSVCLNYAAYAAGKCESVGAMTGCCQQSSVPACGTYIWTGSPARSMFRCFSSTTIVSMLDEPQYVIDASISSASASSASASAAAAASRSRATATTTAASSSTVSSDGNGSSSGSSSKSSGSNNTGAIVGGVVGGVAGLLVLVALMFCLLRRRRRANAKKNGSGNGNGRLGIKARLAYSSRSQKTNNKTYNKTYANHTDGNAVSNNYSNENNAKNNYDSNCRSPDVSLHGTGSDTNTPAPPMTKYHGTLASGIQAPEPQHTQPATTRFEAPEPDQHVYDYAEAPYLHPYPYPPVHVVGQPAPDQHGVSRAGETRFPSDGRTFDGEGKPGTPMVGGSGLGFNRAGGASGGGVDDLGMAYRRAHAEAGEPQHQNNGRTFDGEENTGRPPLGGSLTSLGLDRDGVGSGTRAHRQAEMPDDC